MNGVGADLGGAFTAWVFRFVISRAIEAKPGRDCKCGELPVHASAILTPAPQQWHRGRHARDWAIRWGCRCSTGRAGGSGTGGAGGGTAGKAPFLVMFCRVLSWSGRSG